MEDVKQRENAVSSNAFAESCINLLFRLESVVAALADSSARGHMPDCLEAAKQLLIEFLDFAEREFHDAGDPILERLRAVYQATKMLESALHHGSWSNFKSLLGMRGEVTMESNQQYLELGKLYSILSQEFFNRCQERLEHSPCKASIAASMDLLVQELSTRW